RFVGKRQLERWVVLRERGPVAQHRVQHDHAVASRLGVQIRRLDAHKLRASRQGDLTAQKMAGGIERRPGAGYESSELGAVAVGGLSGEREGGGQDEQNTRPPG